MHIVYTGHMQNPFQKALRYHVALTQTQSIRRKTENITGAFKEQLTAVDCSSGASRRSLGDSRGSWKS